MPSSKPTATPLDHLRGVAVGFGLGVGRRDRGRSVERGRACIGHGRHIARCPTIQIRVFDTDQVRAHVAPARPARTPLPRPLVVASPAIEFACDTRADRTPRTLVAGGRRGRHPFSPRNDQLDQRLPRRTSPRRWPPTGWIGVDLADGVRRSGRPAIERLIVGEEMIAAGAPIACAMRFSNRPVGPTLITLPAPRPAGRVPAEDPVGETTWCIGMSEPNAGSDLASLKTQASATATTG